MSRDLEQELQRLGDAGETPSEQELRRMAREAASESRSLGPARGPRRRWAGVAAVAAALLAASALGVALGSSLTPAGSASMPARGLGFLPAPGWTIVQGETFDVPGATSATAANVPLHPADRPNALPARTIATLPARGVVIHVTFEARGDPARDVAFVRQSLPLQVEDARPASPSEHRLRAAVGGFNVDARIHYGRPTPTAAMVDSAQRQLSRLTVAAERVTLRAYPTILTSGPVTLSGTIDKPVAGEVVDIQAKDCGAQFFRGLAGTTTKGGGSFSTTIHPQISTTLRALWDGNASAPVTVWQRASVYLRTGTRGRLYVTAWGAEAQVFWRKKIQIQQRKAGQWKTVHTVPLTMEGNLGRTYFRLPVPRGTLLRAVLPRSQTKPCFLQGVSPVLRT